MTKKCPACDSTDVKNESGVYALLRMAEGGAIQVNLDTATTAVFTTSLRTCNICGFVALYDEPAN